MNIIYPQNALTLKNMSKSNQWLYRSIAINMLKYNHDSSNTLRLLDGLGSWLYDDFLDVNYQFNLGLNNVDFTTIDRINKFTVASLPNSSYNVNSDTLTFSDILYGYSKYTNNTYPLYNSNILSDMVRYSFPCDAFLEKTPLQYSNPQKIELLPNVRNNINMYVCDSQITVSLETPSFQLAYGVDPVELEFGTATMFEIRGYNRYNEQVSEYIVLEDIWSLVSENVYSKIESVMCIGFKNNVTVTVSPYIKHNAILWDDLYIEREEFDEYLTWCWINTDSNRLSFSTVINDNTYLPKYDLLDQYRFNIGNTEMISDYLLDQANQIITLITQDIRTHENFLYEFPLVIPLNRDLYGTLNNTQEQYVKVSYLRDALNQQFKLYIYPSEKQNNIDSLTITSKKILDMSNYIGPWTSGNTYNIGDIVLKNDYYYICSKANSSSIFRTIGLNTEWVPQVVTIIDNMLLDLITYNIETNLITLNFSDLFPFNEQNILTITTSGNASGSCQVVLQDPILKYTVRKPLLDLFTYSMPSTPAEILGPIPANNNLLLVDNIESYDVGTLPETVPLQPILFSLTSSNYDYVNGYKLIDVYNNFFIDGNSGNLIVSDTITGVVGDLAPPITTTTSTTSSPQFACSFSPFTVEYLTDVNNGQQYLEIVIGTTHIGYDMSQYQMDIYIDDILVDTETYLLNGDFFIGYRQYNPLGTSNTVTGKVVLLGETGILGPDICYDTITVQNTATTTTAPPALTTTVDIPGAMYQTSPRQWSVYDNDTDVEDYSGWGPQTVNITSGHTIGVSGGCDWESATKIRVIDANGNTVGEADWNSTAMFTAQGNTTYSVMIIGR